MQAKQPIGVFDSGYGGLTILKDIKKLLPQYDYIYLGDNARAPYGTRSFETVYEYTLQAVKWFFEQGCPLVVLACNTASAKALRTIQQNDLPKIDNKKRVLGIVRPTSEVIGNFSTNKKIGVLATSGTVKSESYKIEINKFFPDVEVVQKACPIWVPLVEYGEYATEGADFFVKKYLDELLQTEPDIDTILLACTHYPLLLKWIEKNISSGIKVISQGGIVAESLKDYLYRHPEMESKISKNGTLDFYTTDEEEGFTKQANIFYGKPFKAKQVHLSEP
ncbi:glutamate racemase [Arachidicoccus ginsenosidimutans]|uniref:glutamate racemase n=1 Tax=Arachidicoccus sp. BS20 TaxID=1850526 RepID=UPI0007F13C05|nr:glutamate racemase [Arachidicoccus sp. BS20]ANI89522.1 glutamate racemase [Arachidicoccus sp. BS20]